MRPHAPGSGRRRRLLFILSHDTPSSPTPPAPHRPTRPAGVPPGPRPTPQGELKEREKRGKGGNWRAKPHPATARSPHPLQPPPLQPRTTTPHAGDDGGGAAPTYANSGAPRGPPTLPQRLLAALWYFVPAMDLSSLELPILKFVPAARVFLSLTIPRFDDLVSLYYSSQFTPLVVFFAMFLAVVRNNRVHHFIRFHCMQAVTLDICVMLLTLLRSYFPMSFLWSPFLWVFDALAWSAAALPIFYSVFWAIR